MAPEVYRCEGVDVRADIYSFGLVLCRWPQESNTAFTAPNRGDIEASLHGIYEQQMAGLVPPVTARWRRQSRVFASRAVHNVAVVFANCD